MDDTSKEASAAGSTEIEFKFKLDGPGDFQTLARALGHAGELPAAVRQTNRFADTAGRELAASELVLRLREEGGRQIVTAKGPTFESSGDGTLTRKAEEEVVLGEGIVEPSPAEVLRALVDARGGTPLVERLVAVLEGQELRWIGEFVNDRRKLGPVLLPGTEVEVVFELDTTSFPGDVLEYEAEVELPAESVEAAEAALIALFDGAGLPRQSAPSKAKRFFARVDT